MSRSHWHLPEIKALPWAFRSPDGAKRSLTLDPKGRLVIHITHAALPGLTPEDLLWWFQHIGGEIVIEGVRMSRYHAWHPFDHIHWALARPGPSGRAERGARYHIVEALGPDMNQLIDVVEEVAWLDKSGISLEKRVLVFVASSLVHNFGLGPDGASCDSTLTVGFDIPLIGRALNALIRRFKFDEPMGRAWIKHNVEEVGLLPLLIPLARSQPTAEPYT